MVDNDGARFDEENCTTSRICYLSEGVAVNVHNLCLQYKVDKGAGPIKKTRALGKCITLVVIIITYVHGVGL